MAKTICYVDGLNLYHGLSRGQWRGFLWLDLATLSRRVLMAIYKPGELAAVKYFTAPMLNDPQKANRQSTYLSAIEQDQLVTYHLGRHTDATHRCPLCERSYTKPHEKEADTGISAEMIKDVALEGVEAVLLIAADTDYTPPLRIIKKHFPGVATVLAKPPNTGPCDRLRSYSDYFMRIRPQLLAECQLPDVVVTRSGVRLTRPAEFSAPSADQ